MANDPSPFLGVVRAPLVSKDGTPTYVALKLFQDWDNRLTNGLNQIGQLIGDINATAKISGRTEGIGTTVGHLDSGGVVLANGADFSRAYLNKTTDNIGDGTGSPLAGGKAAFDAIVTAPPVPVAHKWVNGMVAGAFTQTQPAYSDITGAPVPPATIAPIAHEWLNSYDAATGAFTQTGPAFSDISGSVAIAQLPVATPAALGIVKPDGTTITIAAGVITSVGGGAVPNFADAEVPSGLINGVNVTYTLAHSPSPGASLILSLGGMVMFQDAGGDYTLSGATITFAAAPGLGPLLAWYRY